MESADFVNKTLAQPETKTQADIEFDRTLLRLHQTPALLAHLAAFAKVESGKYQLVFYDVPDDVIHSVKTLIGPVPTEVSRFTKNGHSMIGFEFSYQALAPQDNSQQPS